MGNKGVGVRGVDQDSPRLDLRTNTIQGRKRLGGPGILSPRAYPFRAVN
jgi:hypothetical protein